MTEEELATAFSGLKGVQMTSAGKVKILKESVDKRQGIRYVYTVEVDVNESVEPDRLQSLNRGLQAREAAPPAEVPVEALSGMEERSIVVVGAGPAGMMAAHALACSGAKVTLLERGDAVKERLGKVRELFKAGVHDEESNICFGEGGAGTFSDGKLTTRKNHPWIRWILDFWVECGAPAEIATAGKPHIGTDRLRALVVNLRNRMKEEGAEVHFNCRVDDLEVEEGRVKALICDDGRRFEGFDAVVWASGHSARDSFEMLERRGVPLQSKPFAVGVRIEHPQSLVNEWLHHGRDDLGAADYKVVCNLSEERSVYSFCMCPGGQVVCSSSHGGRHVVNGMSNYARNSAYANSGLVVKVGPDDFDGEDALAGMRYQEDIEKKAFEAAGKSYLGPGQRARDFLEGRVSESLPESSYEPGLVPVDLNEVLPRALCENLKQSLLEFEAKHPGFAGDHALLIGTETRTSSPIRIPRDAKGASPDVRNFYPCGEGAGYAGGIVSAALDGLTITECLRKRYRARG